MASWRSRIFEQILWLINTKTNLEKTSQQLASDFSNGRPLPKKRDMFETPEPPSRLMKSINCQRRVIQGQAIYTLTPKQGRSDYHVIYLHGGAYIKSFLKPHWDFIGKLIDQLKCTITAPDYPLAPAFTYLDNYQLITAIYQELIERVEPGRLTVMGDSAGGGMSLALAQQLREHQLPQPGNIVLLSPWLDITMTNPGIAALDRLDPLLSVSGLVRAGQLYTGKGDPTHHLISPINGSLNNLGHISLFIGTRDVFLADCRKFRELAAQSGVNIDYYEYADMVHDWMLLPLFEADQVIAQIVNRIKKN